MKCEHLPEQVKLTLTPELVHYGRWDCPACGAFLGWESSPETKARIAANVKKIEHCRKLTNLTEWERNFVASLAQQKLSPKQQVILDRICNKDIL